MKRLLSAFLLAFAGLAPLKTVACTCKTCVGMCKNKPCFGTPDELQKIIDSGFGARLTLYRKVHSSGIFFEYLQPSTVSGAPEGQCRFLKNNLCELHDKGLKPLEGRVAMHGQSTSKLREEITFQWNNSQGLAIVRRWKNRIKNGEFA